MALVWETTDQFGNLLVALSDASSLDSLRSDLADMVGRVFDRHADESATFSVDLDYNEISAPRGDQVSHVLQVGWLASSGLSVEQVKDVLREVGEGHTFEVIGPWPM
jgi:hypothetical protein